MGWVHVVGYRNAGKTTLVAELVAELTHRGIRVGTLKHSEHGHEVDRPGKDSHRHRMAGSAPAVIATASCIAAFRTRKPGEDLAARLAPLFADCDVVLVEGWIEGPGEKIEVYRSIGGEEPLAGGRPGIRAVVTDDPIEAPVPVRPRSDVPALADLVLELAGAGPWPDPTATGRGVVPGSPPAQGSGASPPDSGPHPGATPGVALRKPLSDKGV